LKSNENSPDLTGGACLLCPISSISKTLNIGTVNPFTPPGYTSWTYYALSTIGGADAYLHQQESTNHQGGNPTHLRDRRPGESDKRALIALVLRPMNS